MSQHRGWAVCGDRSVPSGWERERCSRYYPGAMWVLSFVVICVWSSLPVVTFGYQPMLKLCCANTFALYSNVDCWLIRAR